MKTEQMIRTVDASKCVHCHICQKNCGFLSKYGIDIGDTERLGELAYHCFLCGRCSEVCPVRIDGRQVVADMRRRQVEADGGAFVGKKYKRMISEKKDYLYRNYKHAAGKSVLFPGCNFPSVYPRTTRRLAELLRECAGIGIVYECCGKPIADIGMETEEKAIVREIERRLLAKGVTEVILLCPNCYDFLKNNLRIRTVNIYQKLKELRLGEKIPGGGWMFKPCPDRESGEWLSDIEYFLEEKCRLAEDVQCCGLGGNGGVLEPELAKSFAARLKDVPETIYTYCGSCAGNLTRNGCRQVRHVLPEILKTHEKPDTVKSLLNRMKTKYL